MHQNVHQICVDILVLFFPVVADRLRLFFVFDGQRQVDQVGIVDAELTAHGIVLIRRLVIVCDDRVDGAERHFIFFKIGDGVMLDRVRELVAEKAERLTPRGGDVILRVAVCGFRADQTGVCEIV